MGVFYYSGSVALLEDLPLDEEHENIESFIGDVEKGYLLVGDRLLFSLLIFNRNH